MEIKNIISKISTSQEEKRETFLSLEISPEIVKSAVWTVEDGKTIVLNVGSIEEWDENNLDSIITATDQSISNAFEEINPEPDKVIFGLPESWVDGSDIVEDKKKLLGKLCNKLELKPMGFVVTLEALTTFLKEKEGIPVNAIFIHLSETQIIVSLVQSGQVIGSQQVGKSEDLAADVREGLARFGEVENLPTRMILFNGIADFEDAKQQLISFNWQENLPFLHFPKVQALEVATPVKAVAIAGGAEAAKSLGLKIKEKEEGLEESGQEDSFVKKEEDKKESVKKINSKSKIQEAKLENENENIDNVAKLGFISNKDISETEFIDENQDYKINEEKKEPMKTKKELAKEIKTSDKLNQKSKILSNFGIKSLIKSLKNYKKSLTFFIFKPKKPNIFIVVIILFILFTAGGLAFYWYIPKAEVKLYLEPKILEKELDIIIDTQASSIDFDKSIIPGSLKEIEINGSKAKETTGKTVVGEKAKGEVIIYNKSDLEKSFSAGTVLIGPDNLTFILNEGITIASSSSETTEEGEQVTYGKIITSVIASSIGTEFNLKTNTLLSFKQYPSNLYSAKVKDRLTGGISREVRAVSKEDKSMLLEELKSDLRLKAQEQLKMQISSDKELLNRDAELEISNQKFDHEEGDEANNLNLELKTKLLFLVYKKDDFNQLLIAKIADNIPDNFIFNKESTTIKTTDIEVKDNKAYFKSIAKVKLFPSIDLSEVRSNLRGRYPGVVQEYLKSLPNFSQADIKISPHLPAKLNTLPKLVKNIKIEIEMKE